MDTAVTTAINNDPAKRHDFVLLFDVTDGNPNGDPDAGNLPRVDPETMQGLVTDVCLKRKVRDFVSQDKPEDINPGYKIFIEHEQILNERIKRAWIDEKGKVLDKPSKADKKDVRKAMCRNYYDIRLFGAVLSTGKEEKINCGQLRGPLQMTFARSVDPVIPLDTSITRVAWTKESDVDKDGSQMGRKALLPYGLYVGHGFFNASFAEQTHVSTDDLALFWRALTLMFEQDRSASRGMMSCRGLYVFTHDSKLGDAPAHKLFELVTPELKPGVAAPRRFNDYTVTIAEDRLPSGVTLTRVLE